jgi:hypothetical protein
MSTDNPPEQKKAPKVDRNRESWAIFCKDQKEADAALKKATDKIGQTHLIVSAKVTFTTKFHDGNLYKIDIVKTNKN